MSTILFAPETINLAETTRMLETAKAVRSLGQDCLFIAYSRRFAQLIEAAGFELVLLKPETTEEMAEQMIRFDQLKTMRNPFTKQLMAQRVEQEISLIKARAVTKIVTGTSMSIFLSARICEIPLFYIKPFAYSRPQIEAGSMLQNIPFEGLIRRLLLALTYVPKAFKHVEKKYQVKLFKKSLEIFDGDYNLITSFPELTGVADLPADYCYTGFIYAQLDGVLSREIMALKQEERPLIYFSMGSSSNRRLVERFLTVFAKLPYTFLCSVGYYLPEFKNKKFAANVYVSDWLPTEKVNALVDFSIIHGGEGTVQSACMSGKPFIGLGLQMEQKYNVQLCAAYGNAIQIHKKDITVQRLTTLLQELLTDKRYSDKAAALKQLISTKKPGAEQAAEIICTEWPKTIKQ